MKYSQELQHSFMFQLRENSTFHHFLQDYTRKNVVFQEYVR